MHLHALCLSQRITQLEERDVGILRDKLFKESMMRSQLPLATRGDLRDRLGMPFGFHPARPPRARCQRQLQTQRRRTPTYSVAFDY